MISDDIRYVVTFARTPDCRFIFEADEIVPGFQNGRSFVLSANGSQMIDLADESNVLQRYVP